MASSRASFDHHHTPGLQFLNMLLQRNHTVTEGPSLPEALPARAWDWTQEALDALQAPSEAARLEISKSALGEYFGLEGGCWDDVGKNGDRDDGPKRQIAF